MYSEIDPDLIYIMFHIGHPIRMILMAVAVLLFCVAVRSLVIAFRPASNRRMTAREKRRLHRDDVRMFGRYGITWIS